MCSSYGVIIGSWEMWWNTNETSPDECTCFSAKSGMFFLSLAWFQSDKSDVQSLVSGGFFTWIPLTQRVHCKFIIKLWERFSCKRLVKKLERVLSYLEVIMSIRLCVFFKFEQLFQHLQIKLFHNLILILINYGTTQRFLMGLPLKDSFFQSAGG